MNSLSSTARLAGLLYLIVVLTGIFSLAYVPGRLFDWDNPEATIQNITSNEGLYRASLAVKALCYVAFTLLVFVLFRLLQMVDAWYAGLMVALALISVPLSFEILQDQYALLALAENSGGLTPAELHKAVALCLTQYDHGMLVVTVFWGLWLLPFGYLVYKSGFLPKLLGVLLMLGCMGYLVNFLGFTLFSDYGSWGVSSYVGKLPGIAEIGTCLWLLIVGVRQKR
ncbi:MAG: DUF4386 domain-containing protein [Saprospiraceae bacterium]|nr:DUF4386 domain-containing protein [Saprospiraceae bacterium]